MSMIRKTHRVHDLLKQLDFLKVLSKEQKELLLSFLPELPAQKTMTELRREVYDVWAGTNENEWPDEIHGDLETWLEELYEQLKGLELAEHPYWPRKLAESAHPEFLDTEADYAAAPDGTIAASDENLPCHKFQSKWSSVDFIEMKNNKVMSRFSRRVLRWGWGE